MSVVLFRISAVAFAVIASSAMFFAASRAAHLAVVGVALVAVLGLLWLGLAWATLEGAGLEGALRRSRPARIVIVFLLLAAAVEGGLRASWTADVSYLMWPPNSAFELRPAPGVLAGVPASRSRFTVGPDGLRAAPRAGAEDLRVLVVGGSTVESLYLDDTQSWPALMGPALADATGRRVWVGNAGKSGLEAAHHAVLLRTLGTQIRPHVTVVLVGINDLSHALLDATVADWDTAMLQFHDAIGPLTVDGSAQRTGTRTYWAARRLLQLRRGAPGVVQDEEALSYVEARAKRARASRVDRVPELADRLSSYASRLRSIVEAARLLDTRLVFLTQPMLLKPQVGHAEDASLWLGAADRSGERYFTPGAMAQMLAAYNAATLEVCASTGVECYDLAAAIPRDLDHFYDDVHFNVGGSRLVADAVARYLSGTRR